MHQMALKKKPPSRRRLTKMKYSANLGIHFVKYIFVLLTTLFIAIKRFFRQSFHNVMYDSITEEHLGTFPPAAERFYELYI